MKKGFALVLLIFLLVASALVAVVAFSLLSRGTQSGLGLSQSTQALAIALAGKEWYLQQLKDDSDWTDEASQTKDLGAGTFDIAVNTASANRVSFIVTGKVPGYLDQTVQRQISLKAIKLPKACHFAVFWQHKDAAGETLTLNTARGGTQISGDFWSVGSMQVDSPCAVTDGIVYHGDGETVSGSGTYNTPLEVPEPPLPPDMPIIDTSYYDALMDQYDIDIGNNTSGVVWQPPSDPYTLTLTPGTPLEVRDFITYGDLTITGHGKIIANRDVLLHYQGGPRRQTLTIEPSGGTIEILAGRRVRINRWSWRERRRVDIEEGVIIYTADPYPQTWNYSEITQTNRTYYTRIDKAIIMARRTLRVRNGSSITNSILYVDYASTSPANNYLGIDRSTISGLVISRGRISSSWPQYLYSLQMSQASITGLVYQYGYPDGSPGTGGQTLFSGRSSSITGALLVHKFTGGSLGPATITHDVSAVLDALPQGWNGYVMTEPYSWDDN